MIFTLTNTACVWNANPTDCMVCTIINTLYLCCLVVKRLSSSQERGRGEQKPFAYCQFSTSDISKSLQQPSLSVVCTKKKVEWGSGENLLELCLRGPSAVVPSVVSVIRDKLCKQRYHKKRQALLREAYVRFGFGLITALESQGT